ncbi:esterase FE4-like [Nymphalis io]|uniref:esterase FE4-like n=1 Tax=Inachis io TaxID=171585 RepID=UPI002167D957|nr:esterase FE4-like [Nymphalis io]
MMSHSKCYLIIVVCLQISVVLSTKQHNEPIVAIKEGKVKGSSGYLVDGSAYFSFKGIPYAAPPVGNLRFKAPLPPRPWTGIRNAINFGSICTQFNVTYQGDEDCLFINVYTKSLSEEAKFPVMVFIYGGSFTQGSGDFYLPDFLLQHDVILVTFNYRLEALGFLSLETPDVPGNAAMKDQVAALRWVQNNIAQFGGNSNSVTLFGESAGASCVSLHLLSPMSKGLFHKAIAQSGTYDLVQASGAKERAFRAGEFLGIKTNDVQVLLDYFQNLNANALTNITAATFTPDEIYRGLPAKFLPVVEKNFPKIESFLNEEPEKLLLEGKVNRVPLMIGYNSGEGLVIVKYHVTRLDVYNKEPSYYVPREVVKKISKNQLKDFGDRIKKFYVGNRNITEKDLNIICDMQTDINFAYNTHRFAHLYTNSCESTYMYRFNFDTELNVLKIALGLTNLKGASHADELFYIFYNYLNERAYQSQEKLKDIVYKVTKLWTDFAKTGHPTPDNHLRAKWKPYTIKGKEYLNIENPFSLGHYADKKRMEFWDELYTEAGLPHLS